MLRVLIWLFLSGGVTATTYNAVAEQCNAEPSVTASGYRIGSGSDRIVAMERTMMKEYRVHYGDYIFVKGAGHLDGIYRVEDTMNKRFAGQKKIDILIPKHIEGGRWEDVTIYIERKVVPFLKEWEGLSL